MIKIGGTVRLEGKSLGQITKEKDGGAEFYFGDTGSCEMFLKFSPENFRRITDAAFRFQVGEEKKVVYKDDGGEVTAEDIIIMLDDQAVRFKTEAPVDENDVVPMIIIQPVSGKNDNFYGLGIGLNENQATELMERLRGFLDAAKLRRAASKTKRVNPPARSRRSGVRSTLS